MVYAIDMSSQGVDRGERAATATLHRARLPHSQMAAGLHNRSQVQQRVADGLPEFYEPGTRHFASLLQAAA